MSIHNFTLIGLLLKNFIFFLLKNIISFLKVVVYKTQKQLTIIDNYFYETLNYRQEFYLKCQNKSINNSKEYNK